MLLDFLEIELFLFVAVYRVLRVGLSSCVSRFPWKLPKFGRAFYRDVPYNVVQFGTYHTLGKWSALFWRTNGVASDVSSAVEKFLLGGIAGSFAWVILRSLYLRSTKIV